jgi:ribosomal protein S18 acetylase RimI-like enzyme
MSIVNSNQIQYRLHASTPQISIRAAGMEDVDDVAEIITHSFHLQRGIVGWFIPLFKVGIAEDLRYLLRTSNQPRETLKSCQQLCLTAILNQWGQPRVVGTAEVSLRGTKDRDRADRGQYVYISNLAVSQEFRQRGIGQELLKGCEEVAVSWGFNDLYLHVMADNDRAHNLYVKTGYQLLNTESIWSLFPWKRTQRLFLHKRL